MVRVEPAIAIRYAETCGFDQPGPALGDLDRQRAQPIAAIGCAGGEHGVGDQGNAAGSRRRNGHQQHVVMQVHAVDDQLDDDPWVVHSAGTGPGSRW